MRDLYLKKADDPPILSDEDLVAWSLGLDAYPILAFIFQHGVIDAPRAFDAVPTAGSEYDW